MIEVLKKSGPSTRNIRTVSQGRRLIPVYHAIRAGEPFYFETDLEYEEWGDWGPEFDVWGRPISGSSMEPVLREGDIAVFMNRAFEPGDVVQAVGPDGDVVKALRGSPGKEMLYSFNEEFEPFPLGNLEIKGVCVGRIRYGAYRTRHATEFRTKLTWAMRNSNE
jgi:phage repressor protein C with HTH and peptisase S24 domain